MTMKYLTYTIYSRPKTPQRHLYYRNLTIFFNYRNLVDVDIKWFFYLLSLTFDHSFPSLVINLLVMVQDFITKDDL